MFWKQYYFQYDLSNGDKNGANLTVAEPIQGRILFVGAKTYDIHDKSLIALEY